MIRLKRKKMEGPSQGKKSQTIKKMKKIQTFEISLEMTHSKVREMKSKIIITRMKELQQSHHFPVHLKKECLHREQQQRMCSKAPLTSSKQKKVP
jgi:hypothetical protein